MRKRLSVALGVLTALAVIAAVVVLSLQGSDDGAGGHPSSATQASRVAASQLPSTHRISGGASHASGTAAGATGGHQSGGSSTGGAQDSSVGTPPSSPPGAGIALPSLPPLPTLAPLPGVVTELCSQAERDAITKKANQESTDLINHAVDAKAALLASVGGLLGGVTGAIQHQLDAIDAQLQTDLKHVDDLELQALALCESGGDGLNVF